MINKISVTLAFATTVLASAPAEAVDFEFYGRSGDAIEIDFGSLPGVPAGATFSNLVRGRRSHPMLTSSELSEGNFSSDGRFWVFPDAARNTAASGDLDVDEIGYQGAITGSLQVNGQTKTFRVNARAGYTGSGEGAVNQSAEGLGRTNTPLYVAQQQQRLSYLGFVPDGASPLRVTGTFDNNTDEALRTFQAAFLSGSNVNIGQTNVDGIIGPNTAGWLNAANAPAWVELIDPDPQPYPPIFSVSRMIGDYDLLPSFDSDGSGRTGRTPQIERFGVSWAVDLFKAGSALAKERTNITQLMNGLSTDDGYGSSQFHSTHRAGMDVDIHVDYPSQVRGNGSINSAEQGVIDTAVAFIDAGLAGGPERGLLARVITSNYDIRNGIQAARPGTNLYLDPGTSHLNHLHIDIAPPAQQAGLANLTGDFNFDNQVDAADYTVWRDGLGIVYTESDYAMWSASVGQSRGGASAAVPEPSSLGLLVAFGLFRLRPSRF